MENQYKTNQSSRSSLEQKLIDAEWNIKYLFEYKDKYSKEEKKQFFLEYLDALNELMRFDKNN